MVCGPLAVTTAPLNPVVFIFILDPEFVSLEDICDITISSRKKNSARTDDNFLYGGIFFIFRPRNKVQLFKFREAGAEEDDDDNICIKRFV